MNENIKYCGDCPFLKITPRRKRYVDAIPEKHVEGGFVTENRKNECLVEGLWWLSYCGDIKSDAFDVNHPKRSEKCLKLAKHIVNQIANQSPDSDRESNVVLK